MVTPHEGLGKVEYQSRRTAPSQGDPLPSPVRPRTARVGVARTRGNWATRARSSMRGLGRELRRRHDQLGLLRRGVEQVPDRREWNALRVGGGRAGTHPLWSPRVQGPVLPCPVLTGPGQRDNRVRAVLPVHIGRRRLGVRKQRVPLREATHPEQRRAGLGRPSPELEWCHPSPRGTSPMPIALRQYAPRCRTLIVERKERATSEPGGAGTVTDAIRSGSLTRVTCGVVVGGRGFEPSDPSASMRSGSSTLYCAVRCLRLSVQLVLIDPPNYTG